LKQKILIVFGTRPEAIKMIPIIKKFQEYPDIFDTKVCVTAQHREMLDQVLHLFDIVPDYDLNIMEQGQDLYDITSLVLLSMKDVLIATSPDIVLVHGDTSTAFATALAAYYQKIKVAHIEAGLRTGDIYSPWPEEANRRLIAQITTYHFAPTSLNVSSLLKENVNMCNIVLTGNTVIDTLFLLLNSITYKSLKVKKIVQKINQFFRNSKFNIQNSKFILVTIHRRENYGEKMINIFTALQEIARENSNVHFVYPLHLSPYVQKTAKKILGNIENIHLIEPVQYQYFIYMMKQSYFVITDSGGIQEEAPSLGKPVLVVRDLTERQEALKAGTVKLIGTNKEYIKKEIQKLIDNKLAYEQMANTQNPYGDGRASDKIVSFLLRKFTEGEQFNE